MAKKTKQQTEKSKAMEATFRLMAVGSEQTFRRGEAIITFHRDEFGICHWYPGGMHYGVSFRQAADWFTEDDGKGEWTPVTPLIVAVSSGVMDVIAGMAK